MYWLKRFFIYLYTSSCSFSGATHAIYEQEINQAHGYVVYGFDDSTVRVWAPSDPKGRT